MAPPAVASKGDKGPITFDVTTHYQIRADVPPGAMPAVQIPTGQGQGPIILTTAAGEMKTPAPPATPAIPPAQAPPAPPPMPAKPTSGHRARTVRRTAKLRPPAEPQHADTQAPPAAASASAAESAPPAPPAPDAEVPPAIERRRRLPPIPDIPAVPPSETSIRRHVDDEIRNELDVSAEAPTVEDVPGLFDDPLDLTGTERREEKTGSGESDIKWPSAGEEPPGTAEPLDITHIIERALGDEDDEIKRPEELAPSGVEEETEKTEKTEEADEETSMPEGEEASDPLDLGAIEQPAAPTPEEPAPSRVEELAASSVEEDDAETQVFEAKDLEAAMAALDEVSEPLDVGEIEEEEPFDPAQGSEAPKRRGDTSAVMPVWADDESEPLDLAELEQSLDDGKPVKSLDDQAETQEITMPETSVRYAPGKPKGDTSAILPAVPGEMESEPLDLDTRSFEAPVVGSGPVLGPILPSEIDSCLQAISQSQIFSGVAAADRNRIVPFLKAASVPEGTNIMREGDPGTGLYIVKKGRCDIVQHDERGEEQRLATLSPGDCFGEMSLLTGDPASATVHATEDVELLAVTPQDFPRLTEAFPWLGLTLARLIAQRLARTSAHVVDELKKGLFGRLELIPPSALVQAINVNSQSGLLVAQNAKLSFTGYFQDGQIFEAQSEDLDGDEAFYEFLSWTSGSFRFEPRRRPDATRVMGGDTTGLLLEGLRRVDETRRRMGTDTSKLPALTKETAKQPAIKQTEPFTLADVDSAMLALSRLSLFSGLQPSQMQTVISVMQEMHALAGDSIIRQGKEGQALYVVASGALDVVRTNSGGNEEKIATLGPGDCFGEISLITGEATTASVIVRQEGLLLVIPREDLFHLLGRIPILGASLARILASRLAKASRWLKEQDEGFIGRLESMPPAELVQAINVNRQSGKLVVQHESKTMELDFADGEVLDARIDDLNGDEAFFILLGWTKGSFRFGTGRPEGVERRMQSDTMGLLFRGLRRLEQARAKREEIEATSRRAVPMKSEPSVPAPEPKAPEGIPVPSAPGGVLEAMELDLRDVKAIEETTRELGVMALEPLEPGDIRRGLEALAQSPVFYGVQAADRNRILPYLRTAYVESGQDVLAQGRPGRGFFVVMSGSFDVLKRGEGSEERKIATLGQGECFGEMGMLTGEPSDATVAATTEGRLLAIAREDFPALAKALPWLGITMARLMAERLMRASAQVLSELNKGMVGRIEMANPIALVQAINVNAQTGVLTVESPAATFVGYFEEGQLFEAVAGEWKDAEALYELVAWSSGTFRFEPQRREGAVRRLKQDTIGLMLEAMRRVDESKVHSRPVPGHDTKSQPVPVPEAPIEVPGLEDEQSSAAALSRVALFSGVRGDQMLDVLSVMIERGCPAGDVVVRQGQLVPALYLIASGEFEVVQRDAAGVQNRIGSLRTGECFGELALVTGAPAEATVTAVKDGNLYVIPREEVMGLIGRIPDLGATLARILASRLAKTSRWLQEQVQGGISGRLESMPATELVQALQVNGQSGTLVVQSDNRTTEVTFLDGEIQDVRAGEVSGDEAFFRLLAWTAGAFRFEPGRPAVAQRTVTSDTMGLLFRGLRRLERARVKAAEEAREKREPGSTEARGRVIFRQKPFKPPAPKA